MMLNSFSCANLPFICALQFLHDFCPFPNYIVFHCKVLRILYSRYCCRCYCSVTQSCPNLCDLMDCSTPGFLVLHHLPELAQTHVHWVSDAIQPSHPCHSSLSTCPQSLPASGFLPVCQLFASGGQSIEASATASVLPMNIQGWFPLGLTGLISLQSKGLSRVFSSSKASILWHSAFLIIQVSHPYMTPGKTIVLIIWTFVGKVMLYFLICSLGWSLLFFQGASIFSFHGFSHKKIKSVIVSIVSPSVCHEVMELDATIFVLQMLSFKPALPLSSILP